MKRLFAFVATLALGVLPLLAGPLTFNKPVTSTVSALDVGVAFVIRNISNSGGTNTIAYSAPNLAFKQDNAADAGITGCGGTAGSLDVSQTACNTFGKVRDIVNASTNWRMVLVDVLASDTTTSNIVTKSATDANPVDGTTVLFKSSVAWKDGRSLFPNRDKFRTYSPDGKKPVVNPYIGYVPSVKFLGVKTTYGSGTSTIVAYSVKPSGVLGAEVETVQTLYSVAAAATTVDKVINAADLGSDGLYGDRDAKIIVRVENSADLTAISIRAYGVLFNY